MKVLNTVGGGGGGELCSGFGFELVVYYEDEEREEDEVYGRCYSLSVGR